MYPVLPLIGQDTRTTAPSCPVLVSDSYAIANNIPTIWFYEIRFNPA